jgi:CheY-like chemotaxis protein
VDTRADGEAAFDAIRERYATEERYDNKATAQPIDVRQYDCVIMATEFETGVEDPLWDGLQAVRLIRDWEDSKTATSSTGEVFHIPIVALSKLRVLVNDKQEALAAGADLFLLQPFVDYLLNKELDGRVQGMYHRAAFLFCYEA